MNRIYLDYSATTPLDPRVLEAMVAAFGENFGNASSVHSFGREARAIFEKSRETVAHSIGARPDELFFTSGGTEADNHALKGLAAVGLRKGKDEIITSPVEHHAVLHSAEALVKAGCKLIFVPVDGFGMVDPAEVKKRLGPKTALVSLMYANNEVGTLNNIREIGRIVRESGVPMHTDAVQAVGKIAVNAVDLNVDVLSVAAHKFYGPKGIGAIFIRKGTQIDPFVEGGSQESNRRAGTENVPLAVGFAKATEIAQESLQRNLLQITELKQHLRELLLGRFKGILFNGHPTESLPHILNISFDAAVREVDGDALIMGMDLLGVAVTSGSACTSGSLQPSHVLLSMGRDARTARATIRFSIGRETSREELEYAVSALSKVLDKAQKG